MTRHQRNRVRRRRAARHMFDDVPVVVVVHGGDLVHGSSRALGDDRNIIHEVAALKALMRKPYD